MYTYKYEEPLITFIIKKQIICLDYAKCAQVCFNCIRCDLNEKDIFHFLSFNFANDWKKIKS